MKRYTSSLIVLMQGSFFCCEKGDMLDTTHPAVRSRGCFVLFRLFECQKCFVNGLCNAIPRAFSTYRHSSVPILQLNIATFIAHSSKPLYSDLAPKHSTVL